MPNEIRSEAVRGIADKWCEEATLRLLSRQDLYDLAAQIEQVLTGWRKYPESRPRGGGTYLVWYGDGAIRMEAWNDSNSWNGHQWEAGNDDITHWMPLPTPPTTPGTKGNEG